MVTLRRALVEALVAAGVDPLRPRHAARVLKVDKTLMWRVSHVVSHPDVFQAMSHLPRRGGVGILCKALARAGVPAAAVEPVRAGLLAFDALAARHGGDRATFELVAAGFSSAEHSSQSLEHARRLAFRGNSAVWGVQARMQLAACILLPDRAVPARVDVARVFGFVDLLRLRADVSWPLAPRTFFEELPAPEPLDGRGAPADGALLREFSSASLPELHSESGDGTERCILPAGLPGRTGALTALFGCRHRGRAALEDPGALTVELTTPVEQLQIDLLVHERLGRDAPPRVAVHGALDGRSRELLAPGAGTVADLGAGLAGCATPHLPGYAALLEWTLHRLDADPAAFRLFRFALAYPPIPARARLEPVSSGAAPRPGAAA